MVVKRNNYPNILPNTSMYWNNNKKQLEHQVLNPNVSKSSKYFRHVVSLNPYVHVPTSCHIAHESNSILNSSKRPRLCEISGFVFFQKLCSFLSLSICLTLNKILIFIEVPYHTQTHTYTHTHTHTHTCTQGVLGNTKSNLGSWDEPVTKAKLITISLASIWCKSGHVSWGLLEKRLPSTSEGVSWRQPSLCVLRRKESVLCTHLGIMMR